MAGKVPALLVIAAVGFSCEDSGRTAGLATVTLKGRKIAVTVFATEKDRRNAPLACTTLPDGRGYLLLWPRERFAKLEPMADSYDVAFLDRSGKVVDVAKLDRADPEGVVPAVEAAAALLVPPGELAKTGVQKGDAAAIAGAPAAQDLPVMKIGSVPAGVELALNEAERNHGLMFRPRMSAEDGMLFAYDDERAGISFWMMNTLIPLDIAFFKADGTLVNVNETPIAADPRREPVPHSPAAGSVRYVLEMNLGWFKRKGLVDADGKVKPGVKAEFPPQAPRGSFPD
jgi:uncharacterized membrane protein (UPF0127 family)